jgi:hypothetical protein
MSGSVHEERRSCGCQNEERETRSAIEAFLLLLNIQIDCIRVSAQHNASETRYGSDEGS